MTDEDNDDILTFWSQHGHLFPTIAGIARYILAISASSVHFLNQKIFLLKNEQV